MGRRGRKRTRGKARTQLRAAALAGWRTSWSCSSLALDGTSPPWPCGTPPLALSHTAAWIKKKHKPQFGDKSIKNQFLNFFLVPMTV